ncbi:MAG: hypothetical protein ACK4WH_09445, partial [Phycisphaerales bacterium]
MPEREEDNTEQRAAAEADGATTTEERELTEAIDALMAAGGEAVPEQAGAGEVALGAVQNVEDLLAEVAAELSAAEEGAPHEAVAGPGAGDAAGVDEQVAALAEGLAPRTGEGAPGAEGSVEDVGRELEAVAAELAERMEAQDGESAGESAAVVGEGEEAESWIGRVSRTGVVGAGVAGEKAMEDVGWGHEVREVSRGGVGAEGTIEELDETLAEAA